MPIEVTGNFTVNLGQTIVNTTSAPVFLLEMMTPNLDDFRFLNLGTIRSIAVGFVDVFEDGPRTNSMGELNNQGIIEAISTTVPHNSMEASNSQAHALYNVMPDLIQNSGRITASAYNIAIAVDNYEPSILVNHVGGIIEATSTWIAGSSAGVFAHNGGRIFNDGGITASGAGNVYGIRIDRMEIAPWAFGPGNTLVQTGEASQVVNNGHITATSTSPGQSFGIAVTGLATPQVGATPIIVNHGTITAETAIFAFDGGFSPNQTPKIWIVNDGVINGSINLDASADGRIDNTGTIFGDIQFGVGATFLDNRNGGFVTGHVDFGPDEATGWGGDQADWFVGLAASHFDGGAGDDHLQGGYANDILIGGSGDDVLLGFGGDDTMEGGPGADTFGGYEGVDTIRYGSSSTAVTVNLVTGTGVGGDAEGDTLIGIENVTGSSFADVLFGSDVANVLDGGAGVDYMAGGAGDDTYFVDNGGDNPIENMGEGYDIINTSVAYAMTLNVEEMHLLGAVQYGVGNVQNNVIFGNAAANELQGLDGNDTLHGDAGIDLLYGQNGDDALFGDADNDALIGDVGNDTLDGGSGQDYMLGGAGDDTYFVDNIGDNPIENSGEGNDTIFASTSYAMTLNVETMHMTGTAPYGVGNSQDNIIYGDDSFNELQGLDGNDTLYGGGGGAFDLLYGQNGNDILFGQDGDDALIGDAGNDSLDGGTGADYLLGGTGDDTYFVDDFRDYPIESPGGGNDIIMASVSYTITANVETMQLVGSAQNGNGNDDANTIIGNGLVNEIRGLGGDDHIIGGGNTDFLYGGAGADTFVYQAASDAAPVALDAIMDFQVGVDHIDLSAVHTSVSDTFFFTQSGGNTFLHVDLGGNGSDDMLINIFQVTGVTTADVIWGP